jgi:hypothetical protein
MTSELKGGETVLTGLLEDPSALFGVVAQIEALGLELLELRQIRARPKSPDAARRFPAPQNRDTRAFDGLVTGLSDRDE